MIATEQIARVGTERAKVLDRVGAVREDLEARFLAAVVYEPQAAAGITTPPQLSSKRRRIWSALHDVLARDPELGAAALLEEARRELILRGELDAVGGHEALDTLPDAVPERPLAYYVRRLREFDTEAEIGATLRRAQAALEEHDVAAARDLAAQIATVPASDGPRTAWRTPEQRAHALGARGAEVMPTGIPVLDEGLRGGLRPGKLVVLCGAPGAGKTSLGVQLARDYCRRGYPTGILACDEGADGLLIRWGQAEGLVRDDLEAGVDGARDYLGRALAGLPLVLVDADESEACVEDVIERVALMSRELGRPGVLLVDSVQTARCREHVGVPQVPDRERIDAVTRAARRAAEVVGLLVLTTSEASRALYRGGADPAINPLAAGKGSGSIEYAAGLQLVLVSVSGEPDLVDVIIPKNRIGNGREGFRIALDRDRMRFSQTDKAEEFSNEEVERQRERVNQSKVEIAANRLCAELLGKAAAGIEIRNQRELRTLIPGRNAFRSDVIAHLAAQGRIEGGGGKPYRVRSGSEEGNDD